MNKKCQVFTPQNYVNELLNSVGYVEDVYGKKILENSCGDGNILLEIVQRYIDDCYKNSFSKKKIRNGLMKDIHGVEIDSKQYQKCILNLNNLLAKNQLDPIEWSISNEDYLKKEDVKEFHFIVGNPPYITYSELKVSDRFFLKEKFSSCKKGKFDYCYAFIEKSMSCLSNDGKMAYLIPSSIFKTVFGATLRDLMLNFLEEIKDFSKKQLFDDALVKSAIIVLNKSKKEKIFHYTDNSLKKDLKLNISSLGEKWVFTKSPYTGKRRIGDYFKVSHTIATLFNEAFVLRANTYKEEEQKYFVCNNYYIEKQLIMNTATPRTLKATIIEKIVFPYYYEDGTLKRYSENLFIELFPNATKYLNRYRVQLDNRKSDYSSKWFEYGRSQALANLNNEKLLLSTVITNQVFVYALNKETIPYSGMYIIKKNSNKQYTLEYLRNLLMHKEFLEYVYNIGIPISGNSVRITSKDIEDYRF